MAEKENTKFLPVAGLLYIPGLEITYYLLNPRPIRKADDWMSDDTNTFYVVSGYSGTPSHVVVKGPFVIDYRAAGDKIMVTLQAEQEEEGEDKIIADEVKDLFQSARIAVNN